MIYVHFQGRPFKITVIQVYAPTKNAEKGEVEWFYEDLQDFLELTPPKNILFIIGDWSAKVGSQETPGITGKFGLGVQNVQVIWNKMWVKIYWIFKQGIHFHSFRKQKKEEKFLSICTILFHPCNNLGGKGRWRQDRRISVGTILSSQNRYNRN